MTWPACAAASICAVASISPALADRCDDLAASLKSQVDGIAVGQTAANVIYLSHPAARQLRLGCASRSVTNEIYAESDSRKPSSAFTELVASAAAIAFTIPKSDTITGTTRCLGQLGLLRGDDIRMRFRRLDFRCTRSKTGATISIARARDS